jgi:hypothetical protein
VSSFTEDVDVRNQLSPRTHDWTLLQPFSYYLGEPDGPTIQVQAGFTTDFASVPRALWWFAGPWGRHGRAAIVHDWLYQRGTIDPTPQSDPGSGRRPDRAEADQIFLEAMEVLDRVILERQWWGRHTRLLDVRLRVAAPKRRIMWAAVRVFGVRAYLERQSEGQAESLS